jgi:hypothetical protein
MLGLRARLIVPLAVFMAGATASAQTYLSATITNGQENPPANPTLSTGGARPVSFGTVTLVIDASNTSGAAIANTNATQTINVAVTITPEAGSATTTSFVLAPRSHVGFVLATQYPATAGIRGSIRFSTSFADLAVTGLRFSSRNSFSSLGGAQ